MDSKKLAAFCLAALTTHVLAGDAQVTRKVTVDQKHCTEKSDPTKTASIFHFKAEIEKTSDVVHYIISTMDSPSIIVAHSVVPTQFSVDCEKILQRRNGGIELVPPANASGAVTFSKLIEYEDSGDTVKIHNIIGDILPIFDWHYEPLNGHQDEITFLANSTRTTGTIELKIKVFADSGYDNVLPGEPYHSNSSKFTLTFDQLNVTRKKSRYALEFLYLSDGFTKQKEPSFVTSRSIDDEHTPGIFKVLTLTISTIGGGIFAMWKPVAYSKATRNLEDQVLVHNFPAKDGKLLMANHHGWSIADTYFQRAEAYGMNYTIGLHGDDFYNKTRYLGWTALIGYGTPPEDRISTLVIVIISVGLGLPALLILLGGTGLCCRRVISRRNMKYSQIN